MIKVLFVYRGYGENNRNSVIDFQRFSLIKAGVTIETFAIPGGGAKSYFRAIKDLRKFSRKCNADVIHAHYSFSGFIASLGGNKPVVCSLMGSDVLQAGRLIKFMVWFFYKFIWKVTIVKSKEMNALFSKSQLIPNGVDFSNFRPIDKEEAIKKTGFSSSHVNVIFIAEDPNARVKNIALALQAIELTGNKNIKLHSITGKSYEELPYYYNSADLLMLTSLSEGSPNVIKEAMACNCPIVATDVGDIKQVIGNTEGCFITNFEPSDVAAKINRALAFGKRTNGREAIKHLNSEVVAEKIIEVYNQIIKK